MVISVFTGFMLALILLGLRDFLVSRKHHQTFQVIICCFVMLFLMLNMSSHLDVINTRTPNPDKALPYFIAVEHMLGVGAALMIALHWYL